MIFRLLLIITFLIHVYVLSAIVPAIDKISLSGTIKDHANGEALMGVTVSIRQLKTGAATNQSGFYSITIPKGQYTIEVSYLGYQTQILHVDLTTSKKLDLEMQMATKEMKEVVVSSKKTDMIESNTMSKQQVSINTMRKMPALMGEVDLLKVVQLLPGVVSAGEGSSSFSVRGGGIDQNLILLDDAPIFNASHMMGFFSVFNNDAIRNMTLYKGDIPASYGGRLSSLLEVQTKDGNSKKLAGSGGIGLISSRLTLEGPLDSNKTTFIVSGRRTYADLFLKLSHNADIKDNELYFYDLNAKINHKFDKNNRVFISTYLGSDFFNNSNVGFSFGNAAVTARWNHLFSQKLFSNISLNYSRFRYNLQSKYSADNNFDWQYAMRDFNLRSDFTYVGNPSHTLKFGYTGIYHILHPGKITTEDKVPESSGFVLPSVYAIENSLYITDEYKLSERLFVKAGLRSTCFADIGKGTVYNYDSNYNSIDSTVYKSGQIIKAFLRVSPRLGINYLIDENSSFKASYARTNQYLQMASNSTAGTPLDLWFTSGKNIQPQGCHQFAIGYFRSLFTNTIETSVELFYKRMNNTIDFKDHAQLIMNRELDGELRFGKSYAYGAEFQLQKTKGKLTGWVSYTYSHARCTINGINDNQPYRSPFDRPNTVYVVGNYELKKGLYFGTNFVYATGLPITYPVGRMEIDGVILPVYSKRNAYRMPDYHRLDVSLTWVPRSIKNRKWKSEWNFSLYNAYGHKNAWAINFVQEQNDPYKTKAEMTYLFSVVPSVTYNFKF